MKKHSLRKRKLTAGVLLFFCVMVLTLSNVFAKERAAGIAKYGVSITPTENGEGMTDITLTGTSAAGKTVDIPVYCMRKGTEEGKHYTLIFAGDGFTADQQDNFISDAKAKFNLFINTPPMDDFAEYFDAYAALVPSEGSGKYGSGNDTFFRISSPNSINKTPVFKNVRNPLALALNINKDKDVYSTILIANFNLGGGMSQNYHSLVGKGSHEVFIHETGHAANSLADEYYMKAYTNNGKATRANRIYIGDLAKDGLSEEERQKLTMYDFDKLDVSKVRWNAYLGFRGVYVDGFDASKDGLSIKEFRPNHKQSMMGAAGRPFCPVCEAEIFAQLNSHFGYPYKIFVPKPEFSYRLKEKPIYYCNQQNNANTKKPDVTYLPSQDKLGKPEAEFATFDSLSKVDSAGNNTDFLKVMKHDMTFRTVVLPFQSPANLKLRITVLDKDKLLAVREQDFQITKKYASGYSAPYATSLELTIPQEDWEDIIAESCPNEFRILGEVIDNATGYVLETTDASLDMP